MTTFNKASQDTRNQSQYNDEFTKQDDAKKKSLNDREGENDYNEQGRNRENQNKDRDDVNKTKRNEDDKNRQRHSGDEQ